MKPEIVNAVLVRGGYHCAWCACKLNTGQVADAGTVCKLDAFDADSSFVASCISCAAEYSRWWNYAFAYSADTARRILGRCDALKSGPFCDYLDLVCKFNPDVPVRTKRGLLTPFSTALARIEAQRSLPLDLRRVA